MVLSFSKICSATTNIDREKLRIKSQTELFNFDIHFDNLNVDIIKQAEELLTRAIDTTYDELTHIKVLSFATLLQPLINLDIAKNRIHNLLALAMELDQYSHLKDNIDTLLQKTVEDSEQAVNFQADFYKLFKKYVASNFKKEKKLTSEEHRYVEVLQKQYKRSGFDLNVKSRNKLIILEEQLIELQGRFEENIQHESKTMSFSKEQLQGLPDAWLAGKNGQSINNYQIVLEDANADMILRYAADRNTRKRVYLKVNSYGAEVNKPFLLKAAEIRQEIAKLLGYTSYVDYVVEPGMLNNEKAVKDFLLKLHEKFREFQVNLAQDLTTCVDFELHHYDIPYFMKLRENKFCDDIGNEEISKYLPVKTVVAGILKIYETNLGLKFSLIDTKDTWHHEVSYYEVSHIADEEQKQIGSFYLDLYSVKSELNNKTYDLVDGCDISKLTNEEGKRQLHQSVLFCNFSKDKNLSFKELKAFFTSFTGLIQNICAKTQLAFFNHIQEESDSAQMPLQIMEHWIYDVKVLREISGQVDSTDTEFSSLVKQIKLEENSHVAYKIIQQLMYIHFELTLNNFNSKKIVLIDLQKKWQDTQNQFTLLPRDETFFPASFLPFMNGSQVCSYGALYSDVIACDIFAEMFRRDVRDPEIGIDCLKDVLDPEAGMKYRKGILEPGATKDARELVVNLLGRDPDKNMRAYMRYRGLHSDLLYGYRSFHTSTTTSPRCSMAGSATNLVGLARSSNLTTPAPSPRHRNSIIVAPQF